MAVERSTLQVSGISRMLVVQTDADVEFALGEWQQYQNVRLVLTSTACEALELIKDIVFIEVTLDKHDDKVLSRFGDALARIPEVIEANLVTGEYDYLVKVAVADTTHYERFLREKLYRIQGIRHTRSTFSLRTLKRVISADPLLVNARV